MLNTERTIMSPLQKDDYEDVLGMFHETDTFKYIRPLDGKSDEWYRSFLDGKRRIIDEGKGYYWIVRQLENGRDIGSANLYAFMDTDMIQLGCQLKSAYWGNGYATELMARVLDFALGDFGLDVVYGFFQPDNIASRRILNRLGFSFCKLMPVGEDLVEVHRYPKEQVVG